MFGRSRHHRRQIELQCPACGSLQSEPAMAISSYCRKCGAYFRIEKGVAVKPPGQRHSSIVPIVEEASEAPPATQKLSETIKAPSESADSEDKGLGQTWMEEALQRSWDEKRRDFREITEGAAGVDFRQSNDKPLSERAHQEDDGDENDEEQAGQTDAMEESADEIVSPEIGRLAQPVETLKQGSMSAMLGGIIDRIATGGTEEGFRPKMPPNFVPADPRKGAGPEKREVRCFECNHRQMVSLAAKSTQCAKCSVYISLANHDISTDWSHNIRTRGNVRIRKKGQVMGCDVACHDLEVEGKIAASVDCSGDADFRSSCKIMGNMHCRRLRVEKKCEVSFPQGVIAESAEIHGAIFGNITCSGTIRIFKNGKVEGNATAKAVELKDGGVLSGKMSIQSGIDITLPEKKGYLKTD